MAGRTPKLDRIAPAPIGPGAIAATAGLNALGRGIGDIAGGGTSVAQEFIDRRDEARRKLLVEEKTIELNSALNTAQEAFLQTPYEDEEDVAFATAAKGMFQEIIGEHDDFDTEFAMDMLLLQKQGEATDWGERASFARFTNKKVRTQEFAIDQGVVDYGSIGDPDDAAAKERETLSFIHHSDTTPEAEKPKLIEDTLNRMQVSRADYLVDNDPKSLLRMMENPDFLPKIPSSDRTAYENKARRKILNNQVLEDESLSSDWMTRLGTGELSTADQIGGLLTEINRSNASSGAKLQWARIARTEKFGTDPSRTDTFLKGNIYRQIMAQDPSDPFTLASLSPLVNNGLSIGDATELINFHRSFAGSSELAAMDKRTWHKALQTGFDMISQSTLFRKHPASEKIAMEWMVKASALGSEYMADPSKDLLDLLNVDDPNYILDLAAKNIPTIKEQADFIATEFGRTESVPQRQTSKTGRIAKDRETKARIMEERAEKKRREAETTRLGRVGSDGEVELEPVEPLAEPDKPIGDFFKELRTK